MFKNNVCVTVQMKLYSAKARWKALQQLKC